MVFQFAHSMTKLSGGVVVTAALQRDWFSQNIINSLEDHCMMARFFFEEHVLVAHWKAERAMSIFTSNGLSICSQ